MSILSHKEAQDAQMGVSCGQLLCLRLLFFSCCILHSAFLSACPPDWIQPPHYFGYASETGSFHYWRDVARVDFGNGLKIPLRFDFDSARDESSPYLCAGWRCLLFEAGVVQKAPTILEVTLLGGQKLYLVQDKTPSTIHSSPFTLKYASQDGHWRAERKGNMLEVVRDCGWAMKFQLSRSSMIKGQIASLTTDQGRTLV
ncbi:MAG: hypothetical protein HY360_02865, partial [Verrucomicrobia bacterium]|nr:hypothetical protein [Verrucomicrobiota bacterium]